MRVVVVGSHGTGKSSLAKGLAQKLNANYIHDIVTDEICPQGFVINEKTTFELQLLLASRQWQLEKITKEPWVADKCLFDYLVYMRDDFDSDIKSAIWKIVKNNANYDFIFYLPVEFPMELNEWRSPDLEFQKAIDQKYRKLLDDWSVKYTILRSYPANSKEEQKQAIDKRINDAIIECTKQQKKGAKKWEAR
jgi:adenylate kinase family enzyme